MEDRETVGGRRRELLSWLVALAWAGLIYATVPLVRTVQEWVAQSLGSAFFGYLTIAGLGAGVLLAVMVLLRRASFRPASLVWLGGVAAVSVWWTLGLWERPEEAVHFLEYGLLGLLLARALRCRLRDPSAFGAAVLLATGIGLVDELLQWATPRRYFDLRDVWLNTCAAGLALIGLWKGVLRPADVEPPDVRGVRLVLRLAVALVVLIGLCLGATPQRLEALAERLSWVRPLLDPGDVIVEYGYRHEVDGIGTFSSRFKIEELSSIDQAEGAAAGEAIRTFKGGYGELLRIYTSGRYPFIHEARVHIFSRDRNLVEARSIGEEGGEGSAEWRQRVIRADREDLILERFFPLTLAASGRRLGPGVRQRLDAAARDIEREIGSEGGRGAGIGFESKAGAHLISVMSEQALRQLLVGLGMLLLAADVVLGRRQRRCNGAGRGDEA